MASNKFLTWLLEKPLNIDPTKAGKTLLGLNAVGMGAAALSNTFAAATDKNTSAEDKKFLVPAGLATGVANLATYFSVTTVIIDKLQGNEEKKITGLAEGVLQTMEKEGKLVNNAISYVNKAIDKAENGFMGTGLFKKSKEYVKTMKETLVEECDKNGKITQLTKAGKKLFESNFKSGFGVLGAFIGAIVGSAILTPIIRDVSAYAIQKMREKKNPELKETPYMPYFEPTRIESHRYGNPTKKQPLSMKSYMAFTNGNMKI